MSGWRVSTHCGGVAVGVPRRPSGPPVPACRWRGQAIRIPAGQAGARVLTRRTPRSSPTTGRLPPCDGHLRLRPLQASARGVSMHQARVPGLAPSVPPGGLPENGDAETAARQRLPVAWWRPARPVSPPVASRSVLQPAAARSSPHFRRAGEFRLAFGASGFALTAGCLSSACLACRGVMPSRCTCRHAAGILCRSPRTIRNASGSRSAGPVDSHAVASRATRLRRPCRGGSAACPRRRV